MHNHHHTTSGPPRTCQETAAMPSKPLESIRRAAVVLLLAAVVGATAVAQDGVIGSGRGVPVIGSPAGADCESCRSQMRPPWHGSAVAGYGQRVSQGHGVAPCMTGACGPGHAAPCRTCGPSPCGPCAPWAPWASRESSRAEWRVSRPSRASRASLASRPSRASRCRLRSAFISA